MYEKMNSNGMVIMLCLGIALIGDGLFCIITGDGGNAFGIWGVVPVVNWIGWLLLPVGIIISLISIRKLIRGESKPKYTEEEIAQSKADYQRRYLEKHGVLPDEENKDA